MVVLLVACKSVLLDLPPQLLCTNNVINPEQTDYPKILFVFDKLSNVARGGRDFSCEAVTFKSL